MRSTTSRTSLVTAIKRRLVQLSNRKNHHCTNLQHKQKQKLYQTNHRPLSTLTRTTRAIFPSLMMSNINSIKSNNNINIINNINFSTNSNSNSNSSSAHPIEFNHDFTFLDTIWSGSKSPSSLYDVIVLNCPNEPLVNGLCKHANCVICADGGANSLYQSGSGDISPYAIVGDLDSVDDIILDYFEKKGSKRIIKPSQDDNDFTKSLNYLISLQNNIKYTLCWGAFGDRFDHVMQAFNVINKLSTKWMNDKLMNDNDINNKINNGEKVQLDQDSEILLMSPKNFSFALLPGTHKIKCANIQGEICGLLPIYGNATLTTNGFRWNLNNKELKFGGLISSSNELVSNEVEVTTDRLVVFHTVINIDNDQETWGW